MKDSCSHSLTMEVVGLARRALHWIAETCLGDGNSSAQDPAVRACRNCCLEVLVLAAEMTGKKRWGEAYQRQHSIGCTVLVHVASQDCAIYLLEYALWIPLRGFLHLHTGC
jgi:hypothetical protein